MRSEVIKILQKEKTLDLEGVLGAGYKNFQRGEPVDIPSVYSAVDRMSRTILGLYVELGSMNGKPVNPITDPIGLSSQGQDLGIYFKHFEDIPEYPQVSARNLSSLQRRVAEEALGLIPGKRLAERLTRGRSIGLYYEHLAGNIDLGTDVEATGFANPNAGYWELLTANYLHEKGRDLILGYMQDVGRLSPPYYRLDTSDEAVEARQQERSRWGVVAATDLSALQAWEGFVERGDPDSERARHAARMVFSYQTRIQEVERRRDISAVEVREALNPFQAL